MGFVIEDAVYRNNKLRDWIISTFPNDHDQAVAWETFFEIRRMFPETDMILRGEKVAGGVQSR